MANDSGSVIIRRVKKVQGGGHHGGAWKVAYADFVTAMMAFFMVMWIVGISDKQTRAAISEYFNNPSATIGQAQKPSAGANGPGGAGDALIKIGNEKKTGAAETQIHANIKVEVSKADALKAAREADRERLEALKKELLKAISSSQALAPFKDQLLLDITKEGLRIQIVDKQNRPMFDRGGSSLKSYTSTILNELAPFLDSVPNHLSISGHTDVTQFGHDDGYTNWELSADRANAARRALIRGGMSPDHIDRIVGLASTVLFDKAHPTSPINRRISIVVMNREAEQEAKAQAGSGEPAADTTAESPAPEAPAEAPAPAAHGTGGH